MESQQFSALRRLTTFELDLCKHKFKDLLNFGGDISSSFSTLYYSDSYMEESYTLLPNEWFVMFDFNQNPSFI